MRTSKVFPLIAASLAGCASTPFGHTPEEETPRDTEAPWLDVRAPLRGSIQTGEVTTVEVRGHVEDNLPGVRVLVNGQAARVDAGGNFVVEAPLHPGVTIIQTVARDRRGNTVLDTRAVLAGPFVPVETPVEGAIVARVDARALREGGELLAARLGTDGLSAAVARENPILDELIPCFGARAEVESVRHQLARVQVAPVVGGLAIDAELPDVAVGMRVTYSDGCTQLREAQVQATTSRFRLRGTLRIALDADGRIAVDDGGLDAELGALKIEAGALPTAVAQRIAADVGDRLVTLLAGELTARVPSTILSGLGDEVRDVGDRELELRLRASTLSFDSLGVTLALDSSATMSGGSGAMYLPSATPRPVLEPSRGLAVAISDDALNQLVATLWSAGALDRTLEVPEGVFNGLFDAVEISLRLPPILTALPGSDGVTVLVADVDCHLLKRRAGATPETVARLALSAHMRTSVQVSAQEMTLAAVSPYVIVDVLRASRHEARLLPDGLVKPVGTFIADGLLAALGESISKIPLPATTGIMSVGPSLGATTSAPGYLLVRGSLF